MGKTLVIAEKPSVGRDLSRALPGAFTKHEGYLESDSHVVTWAVGHLVQLAEPDEYDPKYKRWRMDDLPIVPERFKLVVRDERSRKQMAIVSRQLAREELEHVVDATFSADHERTYRGRFHAGSKPRIATEEEAQAIVDACSKWGAEGKLAG